MCSMVASCPVDRENGDFAKQTPDYLARVSWGWVPAFLAPTLAEPANKAWESQCERLNASIDFGDFGYPLSSIIYMPGSRQERHARILISTTATLEEQRSLLAERMREIDAYRQGLFDESGSPRGLELFISIEPGADRPQVPKRGYILEFDIVRRPATIAREIRRVLRGRNSDQRMLGGALKLAGYSVDAFAQTVWKQIQDQNQPTGHLFVDLPMPEFKLHNYRESDKADLLLALPTKYFYGVFDLRGRDAVALRRLRRFWKYIPATEQEALMAKGLDRSTFAESALAMFRKADTGEQMALTVGNGKLSILTAREWWSRSKL